MSDNAAVEKFKFKSLSSSKPPIKKLPYMISGIIGGILIFELISVITLFNFRKWAVIPAVNI